MSQDSDSVWSQIKSKLRPGIDVRNWGVARGYASGSFRLDNVERTSITICGGDMQMPRRISKGDFEKLYAVWDDYRAGNLPRMKLTFPVTKRNLHPQHPAYGAGNMRFGPWPPSLRGGTSRNWERSANPTHAENPSAKPLENPQNSSTLIRPWLVGSDHLKPALARHQFGRPGRGKGKR